MRLEPRPLYHMVMTPLAKALLSFDQALFLAPRSDLSLTTFTVMLTCRYLSNYLFISSKKRKGRPHVPTDFNPISIRTKRAFSCLFFFSRCQCLHFQFSAFNFFFFFVVAFKHAVCGYLNTCTCLNVCVCTYVPGVAGAVVGTSCEVTCVIFFFFSFSLLLDTVAG